MTRSKNAKFFTRFSARPCRGNSKPAPGPWRVPVAPQCARMSGRDELQVFALSRVFGCVSDWIWSHISAYENLKRRQGFVVFVNTNCLLKCVWQLLPPKLCWNFRFCLYLMHFNRLWISGMTEPRSQTSNWNTLISWHLKHTGLHFEWGYLQQNRYYLLAFSGTSRGSVTYPLIATGLPNKRTGSSAPEVIQQATGRWMQYIWQLVFWH